MRVRLVRNGIRRNHLGPPARSQAGRLRKESTQFWNRRLTQDRGDIHARTICLQRVVGLLQPLNNKAFLILPVSFLVGGRAKLTIRDLSIQRKLSVAMQTPNVTSP